ncbi:FKBP-type peptidyl-prolyl cis-trans isomerase [Longispora albida]|uniref:FKBP-type peptidyl-prolyl cis-trans isomerase n=1 Tax=Longispora albida TaxID=203523 RepID=UPI000381E0F5|nr:FKBP-type peptidyl-prolyl cis-trans isomerase [Longispora albida]
MTTAASKTQNARRQAKKEAAARAAAAKAAAAKKRKIVNAGLIALAVIVVIGGVYWIANSGSGDKKTAQAGASATPSGPAADETANLDPALKTKPVVTAGTGQISKLTVTPLVTGTGPETKAGQTIRVNYVGVTFADGKEFDASWKRGEPFEFQVGGGRVIKGWDEGLVGVKVGSRVQLDIPSNMAYGDDASSGRPVGTLRFVVDVLSAK